MDEIVFKVFTPATYVTVGKVSKLLDNGKLIEEQKGFVRVKTESGDIATVDSYGRVTWE